MTQTDLLISTDADGTEHWERSYIPDDQAIITKFVNRDDGTRRNTIVYQSDIPFSVLRLNAEQGININNEQFESIALAYWTPDNLAAALPDGAVAGALTFRYAIVRSTFPDAPEFIFANLTRDLLDDDAITVHPTVTDSAAIDVLVGTAALGTAYFTPPLVDFSTLAEGAGVVYDLPVPGALWTAMGAASAFATLRFAFFAQSGNVLDANDAGASFTVLDDDGIPQTDTPRFVRAFTIGGTPPATPPPRYHTAQQVLDAHRQPAIRIGRRPFGQTVRRFQ